ncbi:hypothetical protein ISN44_As03g016040 [Arabidopsis suecica]|uniref:Transmembrane protein n=2 Tax=Arabidopsis TaxID=3701 RepID=B3H4Q8_ARATH|nr:uncharacterized protein AT3G15548 [Arabidopsis thaliana]AEE75691.1 transmembrane protein [Arabidopsis thaliana]KAG7631370.1 hypothetical protein ISN44_As03g016040 [Arabidopsis suecica]|eukprot:NP_001118637.1 transmembrane protein [Arabidopsis thaliana]
MKSVGPTWHIAVTVPHGRFNAYVALLFKFFFSQ